MIEELKDAEAELATILVMNSLSDFQDFNIDTHKELLVVLDKLVAISNKLEGKTK